MITLALLFLRRQIGSCNWRMDGDNTADRDMNTPKKLRNPDRKTCDTTPLLPPLPLFGARKKLVI